MVVVSIMTQGAGSDIVCVVLVVHRGPATLPRMSKRTSPADAEKISVAADLEDIVKDKRESWRASGAKSRRRQRRYKSLLTQQLLKLHLTDADEPERIDGA